MNKNTEANNPLKAIDTDEVYAPFFEKQFCFMRLFFKPELIQLHFFTR